MDQNISNKLLVIASGALAVGGLFLLLVSIFGETKDNWALNSALAAILLSSLFNVIRLQRKHKEEQEINTGKEPEKGYHE